MKKVKIGIIKEGKVPIDRRVPFTPQQVNEITERFDNVEIKVQSSDIRSFKDDEYQALGAEVVDDVSDCDILMGVKEVPMEDLIDNKTYFFFSHTIKEQPYNRDLLRLILKKKIRLIDYELLTDENNVRIVAFGRYAGLVGAYNAILTFGNRYNLFHLRPAHDCFDLDDLQTEYEKVHLPAIKIALTGGGRVAKGAIEVLNGMKIRRVTPASFISERFDEPVYTQLNSRDYHKTKDDTEFSRAEFYQHPQNFDGDFLKYACEADVLIAGAFWHPAAPRLFTRKDAVSPDFKIRVIADITCDIEGSIPSTKKPSTIDDPIYDYNPTDDKIEPPLTDEGNITVMAVDNLPCELPRNASEDFGHELVVNVLPHLLGNDAQGVIKRATITNDGNLTKGYEYLKNYVGD
ncbi:alanine dehydrogenase [Fulvivirga sp. M361]|uniref:NAD(P)-dependent oxidoreductase n=1 Tax=Fulvivirga sp. M361 TaxID=2594266 RepID=UPI00117A3752|nr:NAD(P)-dependent oxidoreductase [Fulvivirga sp. M361]TRX50416.1 alanine dehydrogenase [Fulvivirga sp. M361]